MRKNTPIPIPETLTASPSPHIRASITTGSIMADVLIALTPAFLWGVYMSGVRALAIAFLTVISCIGLEALTQLIMGRKITVYDGSAAVTGLLLAMTLPVSVPLWMCVVGAFFAIVIVKQIFGGLGKNIVNPALAARVFLFSFAGDMTRFVSPGTRISSIAITLPDADAVSSATPLASLAIGETPDVTVWDMLLGNIGGCIGEVSALLLILGGIYLIIRRVITWHVPVAFIGTVALLSYLFPKAGTSVEFMFYEIFAGGLVLGAIFMATDYATCPITTIGKLIYGVGCGGITILIRYFGGYPEGVSFAILTMNLFVWYLDLVGMPKKFGAVSGSKEKVS